MTSRHKLKPRLWRYLPHIIARFILLRLFSCVLIYLVRRGIIDITAYACANPSAMRSDGKLVIRSDVFVISTGKGLFEARSVDLASGRVGVSFYYPVGSESAHCTMSVAQEWLNR